MKECPFCKEDNMSKSKFCCMCGKEFPAENVAESVQSEETKPSRRFVAFSDETEKEIAPQSKPASRFKPI